MELQALVPTVGHRWMLIHEDSLKEVRLDKKIAWLCVLENWGGRVGETGLITTRSNLCMGD